MLFRRVRVLSIEVHPKRQGHVIIAAEALTMCHAEVASIPSGKNYLIRKGATLTLAVTEGTFPNAKPGDELDGNMFAFHKMHEVQESEDQFAKAA